MAASNRADEPIRRLLTAVRTHLGLDVAFVSQFRHGQRVFRYVDGRAGACPVRVEGADPLEDTFCQLVARGALPQFIRDPANHPVAGRLAVTRQMPVGTHLSVPIRFSDGSVYGTLCCFGLDVTETVDARDVTSLRMVADVVAGYLEEHEQRRLSDDRRRTRLSALRPERELQVVLQPIVELGTGALAGAEALARFPTLGEGPAEVFADAWRVGVGEELESRAVEAALARLDDLPERAYLSINASPGTLTTEAFAAAVRRVPPQRLVVEITEHAAVANYDALLTALDHLRGLGVRIAIDDVGTGFSGLEHILRLSPDTIKVDAALVRGVDYSLDKQAMNAALISFATRVDTTIVAEGIETAGELEALRVLGVVYGQGYHLGRPAACLSSWHRRDAGVASLHRA